MQSSLLSLFSLKRTHFFPSFSLLHFLQFLVSLSLLLSPLSFSLVVVSILFLSFSPIPTTHTPSQGKDVNSSQFSETGRHQPVSESQSASASPVLIRNEIMLGINSGSKLNRELTPPTFFSLTNCFKDYFPQIDPLLSSHPYRLSKFTWYYPG